jgi:large subunit ribosomal protein L2
MLKSLHTKEDFSILTKKRPEKRLILNLQRKAGRGFGGRITVRHKGAGAKKLYRIVDFGQEKLNIKGKVLGLEYDPYRTSFIALVEYADKDKRYILAAHNMKAGDEVVCQDKTELKSGNRMKLAHMPVGTAVYNIEIEPGRGGKMAKSAGSSAIVLAQEGKYTQLQMPSSEIRQILQECFASVGTVSRPEHQYMNIGKAGINRHKGVRPTVRGVTMNPPDHPHGGGEGRSSIGMPFAKTPWGKHAKGVKTRKRKQTNLFIIQRRKKK